MVNMHRILCRNVETLTCVWPQLDRVTAMAWGCMLVYMLGQSQMKATRVEKEWKHDRVTESCSSSEGRGARRGRYLITSLPDSLVIK
eukprot:5572908-Amphidinium_carterae.1